MMLLTSIMQMFGMWDMSVESCNALPALLDPGSQGTWRSSLCVVSLASPCPSLEKLVGDPAVYLSASIWRESITAQSPDMFHSCLFFEVQGGRYWYSCETQQSTQHIFKRKFLRTKQPQSLNGWISCPGNCFSWAFKVIFLFRVL